MTNGSAWSPCHMAPRSAHPCRQTRVLTMPRNGKVFKKPGHLRGGCRRCWGRSIWEATLWHSRGHGCQWHPWRCASGRTCNVVSFVEKSKCNKKGIDDVGGVERLGVRNPPPPQAWDRPACGILHGAENAAQLKVVDTLRSMQGCQQGVAENHAAGGLAWPCWRGVALCAIARHSTVVLLMRQHCCQVG